ncbi:MAG: SRPBCC domain-containing protein [Myxococcaceae bacterium]|nr:MAG: SRPBCC domain-containing protein [Myxococcaceae bacterium]
MTQKTRFPAVRLQRTIPAPAHAVYRAWLEPDLVRQWMAPGSLGVERVDIDERVGGRYSVWQTASGASAGGFECEILELVPDERIVFRWGFVGPRRAEGPVFDSRLTITLREVDRGSTLLTLVHERLDELARAMPDVADKVQLGWELVLEKLGALIARPGTELHP